MTLPLTDIAARMGLAPQALQPWGPGAAKIAPEALWPLPAPTGRLVLVSAITPTPAGEGKTTTAIGLAQGLRRLGGSVCLTLREPSIAPILGVKGGGTGAGRASVEPSSRIDLHLTGDLHAVSLAHNTLAALLDDALHRGRRPFVDPRRVAWRRVVDVGDRALRHVMVGLGRRSDGLPRQSGFDITASSELMAILALCTSPQDLQDRLGRILLGYTADQDPVFARDLPGLGAVAALLADALRPNLVQTSEGVPTLVHTGPFANIAHGCNSVVATRTAMAHAEWTVTEAGFGFDLGGEKFLHLKAPVAGVWPDALVLVVTLRALAWHGDEQDPCSGLSNLDAQVAAASAFGLEPVVAINVFPDDREGDLTRVETALSQRGLRHARCTGVTEGGEGAEELAREVHRAARKRSPTRLYDPHVSSPLEALRAVATHLYGAQDVALTPQADKDLRALDHAGLLPLPVCIAKTPASLSDDAGLRGAPTGHTLTVQALRPATGAGHLVALCGDILTMPGLPPTPRAARLGIDALGRVTGLRST